MYSVQAVQAVQTAHTACVDLHPPSQAFHHPICTSVSRTGRENLPVGHQHLALAPVPQPQHGDYYPHWF